MVIKDYWEIMEKTLESKGNKGNKGINGLSIARGMGYKFDCE